VANGQGPPLEPICGSPPEADALRWSVRPSSGRPGRVLLVVAAAVAAGASATHWMESAVLGVCAALAVLAAVLPFLACTHYALRERQLTVRTAFYRFERDLSAFRAFEVTDRVVWLCTLRERSVLDNYRGLPLYLNGNREAVRAALLAAGLDERP
jgi:hypothetical protein